MTYAGNPLKTGTAGTVLPPGTYVFYFVGHKMKTVEKTVWHKDNQGNSKATKVPGQFEDMLYLWFEREDPNYGPVKAFVRARPVCSDRSTLVKWLRAMAPAKVTKENCGDTDLMWALLQDLSGDAFMLTLQPSNGFNQILTISPPPEGMTVAGSIPKRAADQPLGTEQLPLGANVKVDDDDIPF